MLADAVATPRRWADTQWSTKPIGAAITELTRTKYEPRRISVRGVDIRRMDHPHCGVSQISILGLPDCWRIVLPGCVDSRHRGLVWVVVMEPTNKLRFVRRSVPDKTFGENIAVYKHILQQWWAPKINIGWTDIETGAGEWRDIPIEEESK